MNELLGNQYNLQCNRSEEVLVVSKQDVPLVHSSEKNKSMLLRLSFVFPSIGEGTSKYFIFKFKPPTRMKTLREIVTIVSLSNEVLTTS